MTDPLPLELTDEMLIAKIESLSDWQTTAQLCKLFGIQPEAGTNPVVSDLLSRVQRLVDEGRLLQEFAEYKEYVAHYLSPNPEFWPEEGNND